mgnify:CR=1 FL=1
MVLQRDCEAAVWGWGPTGAVLRIDLAGRTVLITGGGGVLCGAMAKALGLDRAQKAPV